MAYAIMRAAKLASMGSVAASLQHCYRERETLNADKALTPDNQHIGAKSTDEAMGKLRALLPEKRRKDAVLAVEYVMTTSPEWFANATPEQEKDFFERSLKWLANKYGADRIVTASIHRDEATPHLSAFVVPLTQDGRLSAKEFIGSRDKMRADQSSYAAAVESLGLQRGIEGSQAKHQKVKAYYAAIEDGIKNYVTIEPSAVKPRVLKKGMFSTLEESPETIAARVTAAVNKGFAGTVSKAAVSAQNERKAKEAENTAKSLRKRLEAFEEPFRGLTKEQTAQVLNMALAFQKENAKAKEQSKDQSKSKTTSKYRGFSL